MRDPWWPILVLFIGILTIWLGILGPIPNGVLEGLRNWQTLIGVAVALIAAGLAFHNTTRSLTHAAQLESRRRERKLAAVRAVLPLALAQVSSYAEHSAKRLEALINKCVGEALPPRTVEPEVVQPLPAETLKTLTEFIEYSDQIDVSVIEMTVASIQIHDSRLRGMLEDNNDPSETHITVRNELETRIIDAAAIYAGAASAFEYARRQADDLQNTVTWDGVKSALRNMRFYDDTHPRLFEKIEGNASRSSGPFERLSNRRGQRSFEVLKST